MSLCAHIILALSAMEAQRDYCTGSPIDPYRQKDKLINMHKRGDGGGGTPKELTTEVVRCLLYT